MRDDVTVEWVASEHPTDEEVARAARRALIRARHRVLERRQGREVHLERGERQVIERAIMDGVPMLEIAKQHGLTSKRIVGMVNRLTPVLLAERPRLRGGVERPCEHCGETFEVPTQRPKQRFCGKRCSTTVTGRRMNERKWGGRESSEPDGPLDDVAELPDG